MQDVTTAVERAIIDPDRRGEVIDVGGPQNFPSNQLAALQQQAPRKTDRVRHIPRPILRAAAPFSRQAHAALVMDTIDMTVDPPHPHRTERQLTDPLEAL